jgi:hypothetical protein
MVNSMIVFFFRESTNFWASCEFSYNFENRHMFTLNLWSIQDINKIVNFDRHLGYEMNRYFKFSSITTFSNKI